MGRWAAGEALDGQDDADRLPVRQEGSMSTIDSLLDGPPRHLAVCPPHAAAALHLLLPRLSAALGLAATP